MIPYMHASFNTDGGSRQNNDGNGNIGLAQIKWHETVPFADYIEWE